MEDAGLDFLLDAVDRFPLHEGFAGSLDHPDPVPLAVLRELMSPLLLRWTQMPAQVAGKIVGAQSRGSCRQSIHWRHQSSPTRSAQSTDRVNPEAPGWTKSSELTKLKDYEEPRDTEGVVAQEMVRNSDYDEQRRGAAGDD